MSNQKKTSPLQASESDANWFQPFSEQLKEDRKLSFSYFAKLYKVTTPEQLQMVVMMNLVSSLCREVNALRRTSREERMEVYLLTENQVNMFNSATREIAGREDEESEPEEKHSGISVHHANEVFIRKAI